MSDKRTPIQPNPPRWEPNPDPASIEVPGLDTTASTHEQIEQIEQLITIKLQNIDENFSKMHHLLATKILPAVKRYSVGTEPVRDAARFWTSFYEQAAQIRIPTYEDDFSSLNEEAEQSRTPTGHDPSTLQTPSQSHDDSIVSTTEEGSFMPGHDAFSSTPALSRNQRPDDTFATQTEDQSWADSLESPSVRLGREIHKLSSESDDESAIGSSSLPEMPSMRLEQPTPKPEQPAPTPATIKGKGKEKQSGQPLLRNVLRHNLYSASEDSSSSKSPIKPRGKIKTPVPKEYNPYLSPDKKPQDWNGVIDLNDRTVTTPGVSRINYNSRQTPKTPARDLDDDDDDSFSLPAGMSPPVMMSPARIATRKSEVGPLKLGQTPKHDISARITKNLIKDLDPSIARSLIYEDHTTQSQASSMPTPPSLSRYNRRGMDTTDSIVIDSDLESMIRRVGLDVGPGPVGGTPGLRIRPKKAGRAPSSSPPPRMPPNYLDDTVTPQHIKDDLDDSDSDSLDDEMGTTSHPSAAFLMISAQASDDLDDSFESNQSGDSLNEDAGLEGVVPIHPFAQGVVQEGHSFDDDDDSFDYDEQLPTETLFGVPAAERMRLQQQQQQARGYRGDLRMLGEDLLDDTIGIGAQKAMRRMVEESPTPHMRNS